MMKKISKLALLAAATALLFGAIGCSDDNDGDDPTLEKIAISIDEKTVKTTYTVGEPFAPAGITVTATYSDDSTKDVTADATFTATTADGKFTTAKAGKYDVTLTATYGEITSEPVSCKITVGNNDNNKTELNGSENTGGENTGGESTGGESTGGESTGPETPNTPAATALTGTWTALEFVDSTDYADKLAVSAGTALGKVTVEGTGVNWRGGKQDGAFTKWSHLELGKTNEGCLKFEVGAESSVFVEASSTGSTNDSDIALCTGTDGTGTVTGDKQTVNGTGYTTVTFATVPAGTYYLGAFPATTNKRGVRIKSITVTAK